MTAGAAEATQCPRVGLDFDTTIPVEVWGDWGKSLKGWVTVLSAAGAFLEVDDSSLVVLVAM